MDKIFIVCSKVTGIFNVVCKLGDFAQRILLVGNYVINILVLTYIGRTVKIGEVCMGRDCHQFYIYEILN